MSILGSELVWRKAAVNNDTASNGGRMLATAIVSDVKNNIWPDVRQSERTSGSTKYRKAFIHVANDDDLNLIAPKVFVENNTPGDDCVTIFPGTFIDTQSGLTGSERLYGCGQLNADVAQGATSIAVITEGAAFNYIRVGDVIRISDKATIDAVSGNEQYTTVDTVSYVGNVATVGLDDPLDYAFTSIVTKVASVYSPPSDIQATVSGVLVTSTAGTFDHATYPIVPDSIGSVYQNWTLTFTSATDFTAIGDSVGSLGAGNIGSGFQPTNPDYMKPYFVINTLAWGGVFVAGDTLVFSTSPAAVALWYKRVVPAGAASLSGNKVIVAIDGESE